MKTLVIIGAGNMGSAIANALLLHNIIGAEYLCIADPDAEKLKPFAIRGCKTSIHAEDFIAMSDGVLLAIKPQVAPNLLESWKPLFAKETILLSIMAGISEKILCEKSGLQKIVRIMPNTPAQVGMGVSGVYFSSWIKPSEKAEIQTFLESFGIVIPCATEEMINAITALSGSGPAYFFRILEIFSQKAEEMGFSKKESQDIALQTLLGAGALAKNTGEDFGILRQKVTSKGGTTAMALESFEKENLEKVLKNGISLAFKRAEEISNGI